MSSKITRQLFELLLVAIILLDRFKNRETFTGFCRTLPDSFFLRHFRLGTECLYLNPRVIYVFLFASGADIE